MTEMERILRVYRIKERAAKDDFAETTPAARLGSVWPLTLEVWSFKERISAESGLPRHIVHLLRREG